MRRFFVAPEQIKEDLIIITGSDAHHLSRVVRVKESDEVLVFDGTGLEYTVTIEKVELDRVLGRVIAVNSSVKDPMFKVTLVQGIPKGDKMDLIIQKTTELGVVKIVPVLTERTVVKLEDSKKIKRQERWQRIAQEASKQCRRSTVPEIAPIQNLKEYLEGLNEGERGIVFWEEEHSRGIKNILKKQQGDSLMVFVGPEGGFSPEEVDRIKKKGILSVTLGQRILRTETAGLVALALIQYELGDLG